MALKRTAKSCGPDAPTLVSSLRYEAQATVAKEPGHRGEHEVSRKTIRAGKTGVIPVEPVVLPPVLFVARGPRVQSAPGFPCALLNQGG